MLYDIDSSAGYTSYELKNNTIVERSVCYCMQVIYSPRFCALIQMRNARGIFQSRIPLWTPSLTTDPCLTLQSLIMSYSGSSRGCNKRMTMSAIYSRRSTESSENLGFSDHSNCQGWCTQPRTVWAGVPFNLSSYLFFRPPDSFPRKRDRGVAETDRLVQHHRGRTGTASPHAE